MEKKEIIKEYSDLLKKDGKINYLYEVHNSLESGERELVAQYNEQSIAYLPRVVEILKKYEFVFPFLLTNDDNEIQLFALKNEGTNGKENTIKYSLRRVSVILDELEKEENVLKAFLTDVSIDNLDDLYVFGISVIIGEKNKENI